MFVSATLLLVVVTLSGETVSANPQYLIPRYQNAPYFSSGRNVFPFNILNDLFTNKVDPIAQRVTNIQRDVTALSSKVEENKVAAYEKISYLETAQTDTDKKIADLKKDSHEEKSYLEKPLTTFFKKIADFIKDMDKKRSDWHTHMDDEKHDYHTDSHEKASYFERAVRAAYEKITDYIEALNESIHSLNGDIAALQLASTTQGEKITAVETSQEAQGEKITAVETSQEAADTKITALEAANACPTIDGTESKEIDGSCYILYATPTMSATNAVNDCFGKGGKLAEPRDISVVYTGLKTNFAAEIAAITTTGTSKIFLGATFIPASGLTYTFIQSGATGDLATGAGTAGQYLTLDSSDGSLAARDGTTTNEAAYLCQFNK